MADFFCICLLLEDAVHKAVFMAAFV